MPFDKTNKSFISQPSLSCALNQRFLHADIKDRSDWDNLADLCHRCLNAQIFGIGCSQVLC